MTLITRFMLILFVFFASIIGFIWQGGHSQPYPVTVLFTDPDLKPCDTPCLFGIQPGVTTFSSAVALLHKHPFTRRFTANMEGDVFTFPDEALAVVLNRDSGAIITSIEFSMQVGAKSPVEHVSLSQLSKAFGSPDMGANNSLPVRSYTKTLQVVSNHRYGIVGTANTSDSAETLTLYADLPETLGSGSVSGTP